MKRNRGFSIMETMVGIGIVSVVGLGMYTGFSQLDDAVRENQALSQATTSQSLLLSLLETDLANHGLGISDSQPACLVSYDSSSNQFQSSCDSDLIPIPAPGIVTCRSNPDGVGVLATLTLRVTAQELADADTSTPARTPAQITEALSSSGNPLDWVMRHTWTQDNCADYPSASGLADYLNQNIPFVGQGIAGVLSKVVEVNAANLGFSNANGNLNVAFTPNLQRVLRTSGDTTTVEQVRLQNTAEVEAVASLDKVQELPSVSFPYGRYLIRPSGATSQPDIPVEIPVPIFREGTGLADLRVGFVIETLQDDGSWLTLSRPNDAYLVNGIPVEEYTIFAGEQPSSEAIPLRVDRRIRLISGSDYVLGQHSVATPLSTEASDSGNQKLALRMLVREQAVQRAEGAKTQGIIMMNRPLPIGSEPVILNLRLTGAECGGDLNTGNVAPDADYFLRLLSPGADPNSGFTSCEDAQIDPVTQDLILPVELNYASGPVNSVVLDLFVAASGPDRTLTMTMEPDSSRVIEGPASQTIDLTNAGVLPEVNFVQTQAIAIEPVEGEERGTQLTVFFDPIPPRDFILLLEDTTDAAQLQCDLDTGNYVFLDAFGNPISVDEITNYRDPVTSLSIPLNPAATGIQNGDCVDAGTGGTPLRPIGVEAGTQQMDIRIQLLPSDAIEHNRTINLTIASGQASYTVGNRNSASVRLEEYARVNFTAASAAVNEDSGAMGWRQETIPLSIQPTLDEPLTAYIGIYNGNPTDPNALSADSPQDIRFASNPQSISIPAGASTAQVIYQIDNDVEFDRGKSFFATVERVVGGALPGPTPNPISGMPQHSKLMTIEDQDRCAVGEGLTSGQSPTNHFHSRGTTLLETADIDGATVRIGDGYDSVNDRLILDGYDGVESGNTVTYTSVDYTYILRGSNKLFVPNTDVLTSDISQGTYEIDAVYTIEQGVLEIEIASNPDSGTTIEAPLMVDFLRDIVNYQNIGVGSGNRSVTFTLGSDVQAWDGHEDGTTHYYRFVPFPTGTAENWTNSRIEAASDANRFFGNQGYLATVTSEGENQFLQRSFNIDGNAPRGWTGGRSKVTDAQQGDDWYWTEGPEGQEANGLGRWFWRGGNNGRFIRTDNTQGTATSRCNYNNFDGSPIPAGDATRLTFGYGETVNQNGDVVVDPDRRFAIWRCNANGSREEPNGRAAQARGLEFLGLRSFSQTWNDSLLTWADPDYLKGYYVEYGGAEKSAFEIRNLKLAQTSTFSTQTCGVNHGPLPTMCRAWPDLEAGTGSNSSVGDFYSPGTLNSSAEVVDQARARVNLYIDQENYNSVTDRLVVADTTPSQGANTNILVYGPRSVTTEVTGTAGPFNLTGTFYINQGFLQLSASPPPTGRQWADILNRFVEYQNPGNTTDSDYATDRSITYTLGDGVAWPYHPDGTTHFYRFVENDSINWTDARTAAQDNNARYFDENGYLATITSIEEHEFLARSIPRPTNGAPITAWLGGSDADVGGTNTEGVWTWRGGPEAGQQFWQGALLQGRPIIAGDGSVETEALPTCSQQVPARDGSTHNTGDVHVLDMIGNEGAEASPYRFTKWSCAPRNINRPEPSGLVDSSPQEDYLILSATAQGGETWNDTKLDGVSDNSWLDPKGYVAEFGGNNEFFNRSTSQTYRISPEQCFMNEESVSAACLPGTDLNIGNATSPTDANFDFYGSNLLGQTTSRANVKISIETYVNESLTVRDELALRGATGQLSDNSLEKTYMNVPIGFAGIGDNIRVSGTWNFSTGVLRLRAINTSTDTETAISAEAWTSFLNQRVQLLFAPEGDNPAGNRAIEFTLGDALAWDGHEDGTTHFYRFVAYPDGTANSDKEWTASRTAATSNAQQYFGVSGYLATITSLQENQFMASGFSDNEGNPAAGWVGGSDADTVGTTEGNWIWVDGPEAGRRFHSGLDTSIRDNPNDATDLAGWGDLVDSTNCFKQNNEWHLTNFSTNDPLYTTSNFADRILFWRDFGFPPDSSTNPDGKRFSNWSCNGGSAGRQPSNSGSGGQDYLLITGSSRGGGMWNDVGNGGIPGLGDLYTTTGYYVEYGGNGEFNNRKFSATVTVNNACEVQ